MSKYWTKLLLLVMIVSQVICYDRSHRAKRVVIFLKGSKFFVRLNFKCNTLPYTALFAWAAGYRISFSLPTDAQESPLHFHHRRDIYESFETIIHENGLDGRACMLKFLCEASDIVPDSGFFHKLIKIIFTIPEDSEDHFHSYRAPDDCRELMGKCPLSLFQIIEMKQIPDV